VHIAADTAEDAKTAVKPAASAEPAMPAAVSTESTAPADKAVETAERENAAQADTARAELAAAPASRPDDVNLKPVPSPASVTPSRISEQRLPYVTDKKPEQMTMFTEKLLTPEARKHHRIIGQLFSTYWLGEFGVKL